MDIDGLRQTKHQLRASAHLRRLQQPDRDLLSATIFARILSLPHYQQAKSVFSYVSFGNEVSSHAFIAQALADQKRLVIPYCKAENIELFRLTSFDELAPGTLGILEPAIELREEGQRRAGIEELDLLVIPGLAFDRRGGRLGHGKGYFDRFLPGARDDSLLAAVAFECQLVDCVPMAAHDVRVDLVFTEADVYRRDLPRCDLQPTGRTAS